jgi:hypothetical protein
MFWEIDFPWDSSKKYCIFSSNAVSFALQTSSNACINTHWNLYTIMQQPTI